VTPHNTSPSERQGLTSRTAPPRGGGHKSVAMTTRSSSPTGGSPVNNYEPRTLTEAALIAAAARITGDRTVRAVSLNRVVANAERHAAERTPDADYRDVWKQDRPVHPIWAALHEADQKRQHRHSTLVHHEVWGRLERAIEKSSVESLGVAGWVKARKMPLLWRRRLRDACEWNEAIRAHRPLQRLVLAALCYRGKDCHGASRRLVGGGLTLSADLVEMIAARLTASRTRPCCRARVPHLWGRHEPKPLPATRDSAIVGVRRWGDRSGGPAGDPRHVDAVWVDMDWREQE
jgi:hypothetical protein